MNSEKNFFEYVYIQNKNEQRRSTEKVGDI